MVYSAVITIALIITGSLLGTKHAGVTCAVSAGDTGVQVTHYSLVDESQDSVEEGESEPFKCHCNHTCNCEAKQWITGVEIFLLTCVGILVLALTIYSCAAIRIIILKKKKMVKMRKASELEREKKEFERQEIEKRREWVRDAMELGAIPSVQTSQGLPKAAEKYVPKDLE